MNDLSGNQKRLVFLLLFSVLLGSASLIYRSLYRGSVEVIDLDISDEDRSENYSANWRITVHLCGAINKPGVYSFEPGTRLYRALEEAGGCMFEADTGSLNLAAPLKDGKRIYIPFKNIKDSPSSGPAGSAEQVTPRVPPEKKEKNFSQNTLDSGNKPARSQIDPNSASRTELESIPGIGPVLAGRILDYRLQHGRFQSIDDLLQVRGIGPKTLEKIKEYLNIEEI